MKILSIMSGSSLDGLDIGIIDIGLEKGVWRYEIINPATFPYSIDWVDQLRNAYKLNGEELIELDFSYSRMCSEIINDYRVNTDEEFCCISFHGHTIFHNPKEKYTFQLGRPATLAALCNVQVIGDFRSTDISLDGQGAPLMAIVDELLFSEYDAYVNLGGICNITSIVYNNIAAFDIAPCNQILNFIANQQGKDFDINGEIANLGTIKEEIVNEIKKDKYFSLDYPKSLDNNYIRHTFLEPILKLPFSNEDKMISTIKSITDLLLDSLLKLRNEGFFKLGTSILFTGGGALNPVLRDMISYKLSIKGFKAIFPSKTLIEYKELLLMGLLAYLRLENMPNVKSKNTGAIRDSISGAIYEGKT